MSTSPRYQTSQGGRSLREYAVLTFLNAVAAILGILFLAPVI